MYLCWRSIYPLSCMYLEFPRLYFLPITIVRICIPVVINVVFFRALFHNMKQLSIILSENESTSVSFYFMGRVQLRFNKTGQRYNSFIADVITSLECTWSIYLGLLKLGTYKSKKIVLILIKWYMLIKIKRKGISHVFVGYDLKYLRYNLFLQAVLVSLKIYSEPYYAIDSIYCCRNHTKNFLQALYEADHDGSSFWSYLLNLHN